MSEQACFKNELELAQLESRLSFLEEILRNCEEGTAEYDTAEFEIRSVEIKINRLINKNN